MTSVSRVTFAGILVVALFASTTELVGDEDRAPASESQEACLRVFLLAGQSNMEGADTKVDEVDGFPPFVGAAKPQPDVRYVYRLGRGPTASKGWVALAPIDRRLGPEITFARKVKEAIKAPIAIIKSAVGGTTLAYDWNPDSPQEGRQLFRHTIDLVRSALADLDRQGVKYRFEAVLWHQGENDMLNRELGRGYGERLKRFIARLREELGVPDLKFFVGEISHKGIWGMDHRRNMQVVRALQLEVVDSDPRTWWVPTSHLSFEVMGKGQPHYHFGTLGQLQHGEAYADAYLRTIDRSAPRATAEYRDGPPVPRSRPRRGVVLIGGRNIEGEGAWIDDLAAKRAHAELAKPRPDMMYWYSLGGGAHRSKGWVPLGPTGYLGYFGPELSFARALDDEIDDPIAIVKVTDSASVMFDWLPEPDENASRPVYAHLVETVRQSLAAVKARGARVSIEGVFWLGGEHDAYFGPYRPRYGERLKALMARLRQDLGPRLRCFIAELSPKGPWGEERIADVNRQIAAIVADDRDAWSVPTSELPHERVHFGTAGTIRLGESFARRYLEVTKPR